MEPKNVTITIHGKQYNIRSPFGEEYTQKLAAYCDQQMRGIASATSSTDYLGLYVLTLLQVAHNYHKQAEAASAPRPGTEEEIARIIGVLEKAEKDAEAAETESQPPAYTLNPNVL